jgi:hypothetical protein
MSRNSISCPVCGQLWIPIMPLTSWRFPTHYVNGVECPHSMERAVPERG